MTKRWLRLLCLATAFALGGTSLPGTALSKPPQSELTKKLDKALARRPFAKANVGIHVVRARDGKALYSSGADQLLIPASNQKILTTLAALHRFGPTHRFRTRIWSSALPDAEGGVPLIIVEGGGDPAMNSEDWWRLAADLRREGLRVVNGDLSIDDDHFDGPGWHPSWGRVSARAYHAPVGALTANYGSFFVSIWPGAQVGSSVSVDIDPPVGYLRLRNQARTVAGSERPRLSVDRVAGRPAEGSPEEIVRVQGGTRAGGKANRFPRSVLDPGLYAGSVLAYQLEANGIEVGGEINRRGRGEGESILLLEHRGRALSEIVELCMKYSNNSIAETLVKSLAAFSGADVDGESTQQGGWVAGIRAVREELASAGVGLEGAVIVDGSGLSLQNRISPRSLVSALRFGRESFRIGPEFVASMPIAEEDGTLEKRLAGGRGRIRAKTGLLSDARVTSLSGYAERADGEVLVFSILVNGHSGGSGGAMDAVDRVARILLDAPLAVADQR